MISCIDLFCGVGGLTHGLARAGISVEAGIDIDPECRYPYEQNNQARFIERDVKSLPCEDLKTLWQSGSEYRLLAGCAPCQPFSTYSRSGRASRDDVKWDLVAAFARLIEQSKPDLVTMENVPQLVRHCVFDGLLKSLGQYDVWHKVIDCKDIGVPQTRKRLTLLASRVGEIQPDVEAVLVEEQRRTTVRRAISRLPAIAAGETSKSDRLHSACSLSELNLRRIRASKPGGTWRDWDTSLLARCHRRKSGETYPSVYGRMEWDEPAPTITTQCFGYGNGRFGHPEQDRAITLREAAILQTFPKRYRFVADSCPVRFNVLGRLIGNAVPVRLGEVIARSFIRHVAQLG